MMSSGDRHDLELDGILRMHSDRFLCHLTPEDVLRLCGLSPDVERQIRLHRYARPLKLRLIPNERHPPKDVISVRTFLQFALKGPRITELSLTLCRRTDWELLDLVMKALVGGEAVKYLQKFRLDTTGISDLPLNAITCLAQAIRTWSACRSLRFIGTQPHNLLGMFETAPLKSILIGKYFQKKIRFPSDFFAHLKEPQRVERLEIKYSCLETLDEESLASMSRMIHLRILLFESVRGCERLIEASRNWPDLKELSIASDIHAAKEFLVSLVKNSPKIDDVFLSGLSPVSVPWLVPHVRDRSNRLRDLGTELPTIGTIRTLLNRKHFPALDILHIYQFPERFLEDHDDVDLKPSNIQPIRTLTINFGTLEHSISVSAVMRSTLDLCRVTLTKLSIECDAELDDFLKCCGPSLNTLSEILTVEYLPRLSTLRISRSVFEHLFINSDLIQSSLWSASHFKRLELNQIDYSKTPRQNMIDDQGQPNGQPKPRVTEGDEETLLISYSVPIWDQILTRYPHLTLVVHLNRSFANLERRLAGLFSKRKVNLYRKWPHWRIVIGPSLATLRMLHSLTAF